MTIFTISLILFLIMDPLGNIASFLKLTKDLSPKRQAQVIFREMCIALGFILFFHLLGETIFNFLQLSDPAAFISSGLILFLVSLQIIYPNITSGVYHRNAMTSDPFIIPMAIPLIAGPSLLATILIYSHTVESEFVMLSSIFISWALATIIMLFSRQFYRVLGVNGLMACEKLMGMVLILLAIQRFMNGLKLFIDTL